MKKPSPTDHFYVEEADVRLCGFSDGARRCQRVATHRVFRVGKVDYGIFCERHADLRATQLEAAAKKGQA